MRFDLKILVSLALAVMLSACGGGGGDPGKPSSGTGSSGSGTGTGSEVASPTLLVQLVDANGSVVVSNSLSQTDLRYLKVTVKNADGDLQAYKRVDVTLDNASLATLNPKSGTQLTGSNGVALLAISPASVEASGAVTITAKATGIDGLEASDTIDLQITQGTVALSDLTVAPASSVQKGQSFNVSTVASVNGVAASSNSVSVVFASTCGTVAPSSALVDASGKASAVVQTTTEGSCNVTASASGVTTPKSATYTVTGAPVTGIKFVGATPSVIYQSDSPGANSAVMTFKVIDASGSPVAGKTVNASLVNESGGVNFCGASTSAVSATTTGEVKFSVCGGYQPTTIQVRAALVETPTIYTDSNILTVQTGLPTQRFFDLSANQLNFYVGAKYTSKYTGNKVKLSVYAADRQANPVPDGTSVVFVAEGGQINSSGNSSCVISNGGCSVELIGQDYRPLGSSSAGTVEPRPGRVTVLAMADGEESFVDANNNNRYDTGESFEDLGAPYLDKNEDLSYTTSYVSLDGTRTESEETYSVAAGATGAKTCSGTWNMGLSRADTCNQEWNGSGLKADGITRYVPTKVRQKIVIVFSGGEIGLPNAQLANSCNHSSATDSYSSLIDAEYRTALLSCSRSAVMVRLADLNGNPLPADAAIAVAVRKPTDSKCAASLGGSTIGNATEPTQHTALLQDCGFGGESVDFKVTVSAGGASQTTVFTVDIPKTMSLSPSPLTITGTGTSNVTIDGGIGSYTVSSSNTSVATVSGVTSGNFTVSGVAVGSATITVTSSDGQTKSLQVTVQ